MDTLEATTIAANLPARAPAPLPPAGAVGDGRTVAGEGVGAFYGQPWTFRNGFDAVLQRTPVSAWKDPSSQGWLKIKQNSRRDVWRARIDGKVYYLKYYRGDDWATWLKGLLRESACRSEWTGGLYALRAGIAAVAPAGYTTGLHTDTGVCSLLATEAVEPAHPLNEFWEQIEADDHPARQRRDKAQLIELLGEMIARSHQAGFEHLDMHAANILVQPVAPGRYRTLFVDLHSARRGTPMDAHAVVRNLAQLNQWFRRHASVGDRLRFLRAYLRWRNEYETEFELGRPLDVPYRHLVGELVKAADRHARQLWAQRDRRAGREGRYFTRLRLPGGWRGMAVLKTKHLSSESRASGLLLEHDWWCRQLADPLRRFQKSAGEIRKDSHSASVCVTALPHPAGALPVICKRPLARNWRRRLSQMFGRSRCLRGWRTGHALLHRNVPAARPLAVLERRFGPLVFDSLLLTEVIPAAEDLESHLRAQARREPTTWSRHKRHLCELLAAHLRRLEDRGFAHHDCKAGNILVVSLPAPKLVWIDMDGLRLHRRTTPRRYRLEALACLHVSLLEVPGLTRTDRARFLKCYCARFGAAADAWRSLWRELIQRVEQRLRAKAAHRAWKLAHYGRE